MAPHGGLTGLFEALRFAAEKHRTQERKGGGPYVNHLIDVAHLLAVTGGVTDLEWLEAALLHDVIEDAGVTGAEIERLFGAAVRGWVEEVTDDKSLPKADRKRLQIEHAPALSAEARQIKLADKISNVRDLIRTPRDEWPRQRCLEYVAWAEQVVDGCRGLNPPLEALFDQSAAAARRQFTD